MTAAWPGLRLGNRLSEGHRNEVWAGSIDGQRVVVRRSRRPLASLVWELQLLTKLASVAFRVPRPIPTAAGDLHSEQVVVQEWVDGHAPSTNADWQLVARYLQQLHA